MEQDFKNGQNILSGKSKENKWRVTLIDTGLNTMTGGRIKRIKEYLEDDETFCLTYGDGVANIDIAELIKFHNDHGKSATLSSVFPQARFGSIDIEDNQVVMGYPAVPFKDFIKNWKK